MKNLKTNRIYCYYTLISLLPPLEKDNRKDPRVVGPQEETESEKNSKQSSKLEEQGTKFKWQEVPPPSKCSWNICISADDESVTKWYPKKISPTEAEPQVYGYVVIWEEVTRIRVHQYSAWKNGCAWTSRSIVGTESEKLEKANIKGVLLWTF